YSFRVLNKISIFSPQFSPMFIGHFSAGMPAKKVDPRISLGTLFLAAQFLDLLWPVLLLLGIEEVVIAPGHTAMTPLMFTHYPVSHSLVAVMGWAIVFGVIYYLLTGQARGAWLLGALVASHWFLDLIVHSPDLPLWPGSEQLWGLGLWNYPALTLLIEGAILVAGVYYYVRARRSMGLAITWWFRSL